jgi:hypothetical protein
VHLSRLWQHQGKRAEACQLLAEVYGWFTDGELGASASFRTGVKAQGGWRGLTGERPRGALAAIQVKCARELLR